ncbi:MAG: hypothetical protein ACR2KV_10800 [Solirubrobacteraceae bacterium]
MPSRRIEDDDHQPHPPPPPRRSGRGEGVHPAATSIPVRLTRYGLPAGILVAGVIAALVVPGETGVDALVGLVGVCACVVLFNLLLRLGASGDGDRVREATAREFYDEHGRWPDDRRPAK